MLSERPYMRGDYPPDKTSVLTWLVCSIIAGFVIQIAAGAAWMGGGAAFQEHFALSIPALREWRLWTLVTHSFLHDTHYLFHGLGSVLMIFLLGRELLPVLGPRRFVGLYFGATIAGALLWSFAHWQSGGAHIGAMAAANAYLIVFACFYPGRQINFLLLFVPIRITPKHLAAAFVGLTLFGLYFFELRDGRQPFGRFEIAFSAQLGGLAAGWLYYRFLHDADWRRARRPAKQPRSIPAAEDDELPIPALEDDRPPPETREELRAEVDRILDKINAQGLASLTPAEKRRLDEAKDLLSRR
jgi:membrane associated rhomboid family serine protease